MAEATRTNEREVTTTHSVPTVDALKAGDTVVAEGRERVGVERTETVPGKVVLELSEEEAVFLRDVFRHIGGPHHGRRRFATLIDEALYNVGVKYSPQAADGIDRTYRDQGIYFTSQG